MIYHSKERAEAVASDLRRNGYDVLAVLTAEGWTIRYHYDRVHACRQAAYTADWLECIEPAVAQ